MPSSSSADDAPRRSKRLNKRKPVKDAPDEQLPERSRVDAQEKASSMGSSESGSQDSGESNAVPPDDGYKDASQTAEQLKEVDSSAALARFKCPVDGCNESFSKSATTTTAVQHVLEVHHKTLYRKEQVCL